MATINESAIKTPGVYVNEIPSFPPSIAQVATANFSLYRLYGNGC